MKHDTFVSHPCVLCFDLPHFKQYITQLFPAEQGEVACLFGHNSPPGVSIKIIDVFSDSKYPGITDGSNFCWKPMSSTCVTPEKKNPWKLRAPNFAAWGTHSKWGFEEMKYVAHTSLWHYNACLVWEGRPTQAVQLVQGTWVQNGILVGGWVSTHLKNMNVNLENLPQIGNRGENIF